MTPDLERLIQSRKVDVRCRTCGEGSAYTTRCYACGSTDLDIIPHGSEGWTACLGGPGSAMGAKRDTTKATAAARLVRQTPGKRAVGARKAVQGP